MTKQLDDIFNIDPTLTTPEPQQNALVPVDPTVQTVVGNDAPLDALDSDVSYARTNITGAVNKMREAMDSAILLAQSGDSPRAFEVVATMLTAMVNANKELVSLHKAKEDTITTHQQRTQPAASKSGHVNIENAVFVGKASDLLRELKAMKKKQDAPDAPPDIDIVKEG
jgi:hypothetical protein